MCVSVLTSTDLYQRQDLAHGVQRLGADGSSLYRGPARSFLWMPSGSTGTSKLPELS
jgi:hypothetical protein